MHNGLVSEGAQHMLQLWPLPPDLPVNVQADFCLATIGLERAQLQEAGEALREAETLVTEGMPVRKQAALAATQGTCHDLCGALELAIMAYRRQRELYRRASAEFGEYLALGNLGSAQLDAGDIDGAIESLRQSVDALRRINAPYGQETRIGKLALALALRGDDLDVIPLARGAFDHLRSLGVTFSSVMAAAPQHARRNRLKDGVLLAGYARRSREQKKQPFCLIDHRILKFVSERATAEFPAETVETWMRSGERLSESQVASIAFDDVPLDRVA